MIILKYSRYTMETMIRWSNTKNIAMKKIAAVRNFVFNMTECDGVASSTTAVSSAGSPCQSKCFELRLVTLCHSPHPLLSPDIQVPGLSVVCPNGIFYMYQLNWHVACMFQCVEVYVNIMLYIIFIVSIVIFFLSVLKYYSLHLSCEQFFCFISVFISREWTALLVHHFNIYN